MSKLNRESIAAAVTKPGSLNVLLEDHVDPDRIRELDQIKDAVLLLKDVGFLREGTAKAMNRKVTREVLTAVRVHKKALREQRKAEKAAGAAPAETDTPEANSSPEEQGLSEEALNLL